jgi:thioredoxin-dependent peroxiredoxin
MLAAFSTAAVSCKAAPAGSSSGTSSGTPQRPGNATAPVAPVPLDTSWQQSPGKPLSPGEAAPNFEGIAHTGMRVRLSAFLEHPVVVYLYAADRTPAGTSAARAFRDAWLRFNDKLGMVFGVSSDDRVAHRDFATEERLPFLLVADEQGAIARAFGVPLEGVRTTPIVFIVGSDGKVRSVIADQAPEKLAEAVLSALATK